MEERFNDFKAFLGKKKEEISSWYKENKEIIVVCMPIVIGGIFEIGKLVMKRENLDDEESLKQDYIYDHSHGHYYKIKKIRSDKKRNLKYLEMDRRRDSGERLGDILYDMKLLK